ncbi:MAG: TonB-dependent receptor [candidate division KSB1 bacterium]|nr:TonB-dependent receptor [candidate division KSB1 bacterium]
MRFILLLIIPVLLNSAVPTGKIAGTVNDVETGEPLPGVNVTLSGTVMGDASGRDGSFLIERIPAGEYRVRAVMMGYRQDTVRVQVHLSQTTRIRFELSPVILDTPELEVTANKRRQSIQDTPASIGLMTRRDVQRFNNNYANELLQHASGVNFVGTQINIRGSSGFNYGAGSRVLLLVDGVPVMPGDSGNLKWDLVPATQIERVEIIKGAGSALYGSSALGGVINIITKDISPQPILHTRLSAGAYDEPRHELWQWSDRVRLYNNIDVDYSRQLNDRLSVFAAAGRHESMGYAQNSEYLRHNASLKLHSKWSSNQNATLSLNWEGGRREDGLMWESQRHALKSGCGGARRLCGFQQTGSQPVSPLGAAPQSGIKNPLILFSQLLEKCVS